MVPNIYDKNIVQIISPMNRNKMTKKQTSSLASNNSAFLFKLQIKKLPLLDVDFLIQMHALLSNMLIHHIYTYIYICTQGTLEVTQIGSSLSQYFRPKMFFSMGRGNKHILNALQNVKIFLCCKIILAFLISSFHPPQKNTLLPKVTGKHQLCVN